MTAVATTTALAERNLVRFFRSKELLAGTLAFPVVMLLVMLLVFGETVDRVTPGRYVDRLTPGILLFAVAYAAVGTGVGYFQDLRSGFADRLRQLPLGPSAVLTGRMLGDLGRLLVVAIVTVITGYVVGFRFHQGPLAAFGFFAVTLVFATIFLWLAMLVALVSKSEQTVTGSISTPVTLLLFLSSGLVPAASFPGALQPIVEWNPLSLANETLIGLTAGGDVTDPLLKLIAWVVVLNAVFATLAIRLDRRRR